jgi:hypothetical protein
MKTTGAITVAAAVAATALLSAPIAGADNESGFLGDLRIDHATLPGKTDAEMVAAGHATCHHLETGTGIQQEMDNVNKTYGFNGGVDFVGLATTYLCPNWASQQQPKAQGSQHPDGQNCIPGYQWREANSSDHVCVTQQAHDRTQKENGEAAGRVDPNGAYGANSCKQGFVWRNAYNGDAVCVTPNIRDTVATENAQAASKVAH